MSGASPTQATADGAAPAPPTPVPDGSEGAVRFEIDGDTLWRDVLAAVTPDERACVRDALGDELLEWVMERPAVSEGDAVAFDNSGEWELLIFECLAEETARELLISFVVWAWSIEPGLDGELIEADEACLRDVLAEVGVEALLPDDLSVADDGVYWDMLRCAPDLLISFLLVVVDEDGLSVGSGAALDDDQRSCIAEVAAEADWASLVEGTESERYAALEELRPGLSECGLVMAPAVPRADVDDDHADTAEGASPAAVGEAVDGSVDFADDADFFVFEAEAGWPYRIEVSLDTLSDSVATLYDAAGDQLSYDDDSGEDLASRLLWKADSSGRLYVAVEGYDEATGSYTLTIDSPGDVDDDHADTADGASPAAVGEAAQGSVDYELDVDFFVFEAEAGESYRIDVSLGTLSDSVAELYDAEESQLASNDDQESDDLASRLLWRAENSGSYYLAVRGYEALTGSYTLTIERMVDDHSDTASGSTPLAVGEAVQGTVDYSFDVDLFAFEAEAGETYRIVVALGTLSDSVAALYDADDSELDSNDDHHSEDLGSRIDWQAESSGTFYVAVEGYRAETGSYTLTVDRIVEGVSDAADPEVGG